jgi:hypothetical protein
MQQTQVSMELQSRPTFSVGETGPFYIPFFLNEANESVWILNNLSTETLSFCGALKYHEGVLRVQKISDCLFL